MSMRQVKIEKHGLKKDIPLGKMKVSQTAQRNLQEDKVTQILSEFELDFLGTPVVNFREGYYYIIDGQHRIEALKRFLGTGWETQLLECHAYDGLTEAEEADRFDRLNDIRPVSAFDRFKVRVTAKRHDEVIIKKLVEQEHLIISKQKLPGAIQAVGTLAKIYRRSDGPTLQRTLRIIREAYGDAGFEAAIIDGIGHLCHRYNGILDEDIAISVLSNVHGGVKGLLNRATILNKSTGTAKTHCVAAAAVEFINARRGGKKLPNWWKEEEA